MHMNNQQRLSGEATDDDIFFAAFRITYNLESIISKSFQKC